MKIGKGLIGIAASERNNFSWEFIQCLLELKHVTGAGVAYSQIGVLDIARNQLMQMARKYECDWLLMVDSDMTFPKDGVEKLLESMNKADASIGAGLYFKGSAPYDPVALDLIADVPTPITDWKEPREVDGVGMGFTLIKADAFGVEFAFEKIGNRIWGEDFVFCHRAKQRGLKVILDPRVRLGHLRMVKIDEEYIKKIS